MTIKGSRKNNFTFGCLAPVAQALVPAASRLIGTPARTCTKERPDESGPGRVRLWIAPG